MFIKGEDETKVSAGSTAVSFLRMVYSHGNARADSSAVIDKDGNHTFSEFIDRIDRISSYLDSKGVVPGDRVALVLGRTVDHDAARLACISIGAAFLSVNPSHPVERISEMFLECKPSFVLDERTMGEAKCAEPRRKFREDIDDSSPGYIVYTSGSTGKPKGVLHDRTLFLQARHQQDVVAPGIPMRIASLTDMMFIANIAEMCIALYTGDGHVIIPEEARRNPPAMIAFLSTADAVMISGPPALAKLFRATTIRYMGVQGQISDLISIPGIEIVNIYGCSEMCLMSCGNFAGKKYPSIGQPYDGCQTYVADENGKGCDKGEIFVRGPDMMLEYINDPKRTAEKFFTDDKGVKWLRTGDLGMMTPDGIVVMGRMDSMVKVNGQRVEPAEVEYKLKTIAGMVECAVIPYGERRDRLCMFYTGAEELGPNEIRGFLSNMVPPYMVPQKMVRLERMPLNANGKIDRTKLTVPQDPDNREEYVAPRNGAEEVICEAFVRSLGVEEIGIADDFVCLGGDSLKAMSVVSYCSSHGFDISTADILDLRTPERIAYVIRKKDAVCRYTLEGGCPLTGGALDIYLDIESGSSRTEYIIGGEIPIPNGKTADDAKKVISELIEAHPIMKGRVCLRDGSPWFAFDSEPEITVSENEDLNIGMSFNMDSSLCRFHIASKERKIQAAFHHLISDGPSLMIISREAEILFNGGTVEQDTGFLTDASSFTSEGSKTSLDFFRQMFADIPDDTALIPERWGKKGTGKMVLTQKVKDLSSRASEMGTSPAMILFAAFGYTVSRFSGSSHAVLGNLVNGRKGAGNQTGMYARSMPVALDCSDRSVRDFVKRASDAVLGTMSNQGCSFFTISKELGVDFNVVFNYLSGIESEGRHSYRQDRGGDIMFEISVSGDCYILEYEHSSRFSERTVLSMASAFDRIINGIISCETLSEIDYTSEEDRAALDSVNRPSVDMQYGDILDALREKVSEGPDKTLLTYKDRSFSYTDVDKISDSIASALASEGIGKGDLVGVMTERSEWYLIAPLAVMKTGAGYVPIDISYPDERISYMLNDSSSKAILVTPETEERARSLFTDGKVPVIMDITSVPESKFKPVKVSPDDTAVILYTSGTTGKPKGSDITRLAVENLSEWYCRCASFGLDGRMGLHTSFVFDMHTMALYPPIVAGAAIDIIPDEVRLDMESLDLHIKEKKINHLFMTTQLGRIYAQTYPESTLDVLFVAGEKLGEFDTPLRFRMFDGYGPSENLALSTATNVTVRMDPSSVGIINDNSKGYILDREHRRVPYGAVGELFLSGYQLSKGYLNNPEKNSESFFDNPFSDEKGYERIYATGDYFRLLPDGTLGVLGRRDGQVKVRGNRVEITEVESCIRSVPGISDVTVQPITVENGSKELCAYVVSSKKVTPADVQIFVSERKPDYMVPAFVIQIEKIPLNVNGKVDKRALPKPEMSALTSEYVPPRNDAEKILCDALAQSLGIEKIGIDDDFIRLGGDSLKAIRAVSLCRSSGMEVRAKDIISRRTVRSISSEVSAAKDMGSSVGAVKPTPFQSLLMRSGTEQQRDIFIQYADLQVRSNIDIELLNKAMRLLVDRHDSLRLIVGDEVEIRPEGCECFEIVEATAKDDKDILKATDEAFGKLSLSKGIITVCVLMHKGKETYLRLMINHMAVDGVSWNIIISDLSECILALSSGMKPKMPLRTTPFRDWAEKDYEPSESEKKFWSTIPSWESLSCKSEPFVFRIDRNLSNRYGFEPVDIMMTAFAKAFRSMYGRNPVVRMEGHGRDSLVERTVGWFTCMYPLDLKSTDETLADLFNIRSHRRSVPKGGRGYMYLKGSLPDVTFNYLGRSFAFDGELFSTEHLPMEQPVGPDIGEKAAVNILEDDDGYIVSGSFDSSKDLRSVLSEALDSVMASMSGTIRCPLSGPQMNVYLDEVANDMGAAYSVPGMVELPEGADAEKAIKAVIDAHPILCGRITEIDGTPYLTLDSYPEIDRGKTEGFIRPFDLSKCLVRFRITEDHIVWDAHHTIMDAESRKILLSDFRKIYAGETLKEDTGFLIPVMDAPDADYIDDARSFFASILDGDRDLPVPDGNGTPGTVSMHMGINRSALSKLNVTPGAFFASVFGYTLSRFTGSSKAVFPMTERGRFVGAEESVGMFVHTFPVSVDCSDKDVKEFLSAASEVILGAMSHSSIPFTELSRAYNIDTSISFEYLSSINTEVTNVAASEADSITDDAIWDIMLTVSDSGEGYVVSLQYSGRYSEATCRRMIESYSMIANGILCCEKLSEIRYTSDEDIKLEEKVNDTSKKLRYNDILDAFRERVSKDPDSVLIRYLENSCTTKEVDCVSDSIASELASKGVGRGDFVAIMVDRSHWYLICAIAVLKTGAAYVPIDATYPDERVSHMFNDSSVKAVLVSPDTEERARSLTEAHVIDCTSVPESRFKPVDVYPDDTAVILYTSGTTGKPKGSTITRLALENLSEWYVDDSNMGPDDHYGLFASIAFDMHTFMFSPIYSGSYLVVIPEDDRYDIERLNKHFIDYGVKHTFITTNLGKMFASTVKESSIRLLMYGGEKLGEFTAPDFIGAFETYGPSENLAVSVAIFVNDRSDNSSVGYLIPNVKGYILDKEHRRVPYGAVGELFLSGYQLSKGYLNNPEKNVESFLPNPFSKEKGYERMYASGDYFRFLPDGTFGVIGRRDGQVKVRGNRVELTEVEACLRTMPGIIDVSVQPFLTEIGTKELCAYIVSSSTIVPAEVQDYVFEHKPEYMVPAFVIQIEKMPLNFNGKVDKHALPKPDMSSLKTKYVAPRNETERILCDALARSLSIEKMGIDDDFIRLGGDSLKAIRAVSLCRASGLEVKAKDLISKRTVRAISSEVSAAEDMGSSVGTVRPTPFQSLFLVSGTEEMRNTFIQNADLKVHSDLDQKLLSKAMRLLADRHDSLRIIVGDEVEIGPEGCECFEILEVDVKDDEDIIKATKEALGKLYLSKGIVTVCVLMHKGGETFLRIIINHMAVDGVSWSILLSDLSECILALSSDRESELPPRTTPFRDWAEKDYEPSESERKFWSSVPACEPLEVSPEQFSFRIDRDLNNRYGFEPVDIMMATFAKAFRSLYGRNPVVRMEGHGRDSTVERTVGWFTCLYPLDLKSTDDTLGDLFATRSHRRSVPRGGRGYMHLSESLPDVTFNYLGRSFEFESEVFSTSILPIEYSEPPNTGESASVNIFESDSGYEISGFFDPSVDLCKAMTDALDSIMESMTGTIRCTLSEPQMNVYLDEVANDMGTAYSSPGMIPIPEGVDPEKAINAVIAAHPVLRGRITGINGIPYLIIDSNPEIDRGTSEGFIRPFELSESLARFRIAPDRIIWDVHHTIMDAESRRILISDFTKVFAGEPLEEDLGFLISVIDSPDADYLEDAHSYFSTVLEGDRDILDPDGDGTQGTIEAVIPLDKNALGKLSGITPGGFFAAAFGYTLSRYSGSSRSVFPMTEKGRDLPGTQNSIGMFVRTFPVVIDCSDRLVSDFITESSNSILESMSHSRVMFMNLSKEFDLDMTVAFEYLSDINSALRSASATAEPEDDPLKADPVSDIVFTVSEYKDGFLASIQHTGKYSQEICRRILDSFSKICEQLLTRERMADILYTPDDDMEFYEKFNDNSVPLQYPDIITAFRDHLAKDPDATMLIYRDNRYTYAQVNEITDNLAAELSSRDIGSGDNITVMIPRSEWYVLCAIGVMKTGAAYVPIDTAHPDERISFMIKDTSSKAIIVTPETSERASSLSELPLIDCLSLSKSKFEPIPIDQHGNAVLLYTSGTTGQPKGVQITHIGLSNYGQCSCRLTKLKSSDIYGLYASYSFDAHMMPIASAPIVGAGILVIPEEFRLDMGLLAQHMKKNGVDVILLPTKVAQMFIPEAPNSGLRVLQTGGESLGEVPRPEGCELMNCYGPTEGTIICASIYVRDGYINSSVGPLGDNYKAYILDKERRIVPRGAIGELYIAGCQVTPGYLNRPDKNAESFSNNEFCDEEEYSRLYATGDYARILPDGTLGIIGRRDSQVKIKGNRLELTEVEACIKAMPGIKEVTVQLVVGEGGYKELCAYVVSQNEVTYKDVQEFVSERKPDYMVPAFVMQLEKIPLNVNGKVDKRALPKPDLSMLFSEYVAPRNTAEAALCDGFVQALALEKIGIDDDFMRLGGDSLKAIKVVSVCRSAGVEVKAKDIISLHTPRAIAEKAVAAEDMGSSVGELEYTPLHELFLESGTKEERNRFVQSIDLELLKDVTEEQLQKAVDILTDRHDMLRAIYGSEPEVRKQGTRVCEVVSVKADDDEQLLDATEEALGRLSLEDGRLIQCLLVGYEGKKAIRLIINHMIVDGVSWNIVISDLSASLSSVQSDTDPVLPPRTMPFRDWVAQPYEASEKEKKYWSDKTEVREKEWDLSPYSFNIPIKKEELMSPYGFEPVDLMMTAFARAYKSVTGEDPTIRMEGHGRDSTVERTIGWFTCVYPLALHVGDHPVRDIYSVRNARRMVPRGGRGYMHLYPDCVLPATVFNYLGSSFEYSDELMKSIQIPMIRTQGVDMGDGMLINIVEMDGSFVAFGNADPKFGLEERIVAELHKLIEAINEVPYQCPLTGPCLSTFLDELVHEKGTAYSTPGIVPVPPEIPMEKALEMVKQVIEAHPILKCRFFNANGVPYLITDSYPEIDTGAPENFIRPFDMSKTLARFKLLPGLIMWDVHHAIIDSSSRRIMIHNFLDLFQGKSIENETGFLITSTMAPDADAVEESEKFFASTLSGNRGMMLPDYEGKDGSLEMDLPVTRAEVESLEGVTPGGFFISAFGYALSRFMDTSKSVFTILEKGRDVPGTENSVNMLARTVPVAIDCTERTVAEFLHDASDSIMNAMAHNALSFVDISREFNLDVSVLCEYLSDINTEFHSFADPVMAAIPKSDGPKRLGDYICDIAVLVRDKGDGYVVELQHTEKYSEETFNRLIEVYKKVLRGMLTCDNLSDINYTSEEDIELLDRINDTTVEMIYPDVIDVFEERLLANPDAPLLRYGGKTYSYIDVDHITDSISLALLASNVTKGDSVGIVTPHFGWTFLTTLGILKVGAVCVPMMQLGSVKEREDVVEKTSMRVMLTVGKLDEKPAGIEKAIDCLTVKKGDYGHVTVTPSHPASYLFISSSTGIREITQTRIAMENSAEQYLRMAEPEKGGVIGVYPGLKSEIYSVTFSAMIGDLVLDIIPEELCHDMSDLSGYIEESGITDIILPSTIGKLLMQTKLSSIRTMVLTGEKLGVVESELPYKVIDCYSNIKNSISMSIDISKKQYLESIGAPVGNVKAYILDHELRRVPYGAVGELYLSGYQLSTVHGKSSELSDELIPNPFSSEEGFSMMAPTGDRMRMMPDGTLGYIGKISNEVKIRGKYADLVDLTNCIKSMHGIEDAVVMPVKTNSGTNELCAYVISTFPIPPSAVQSYVLDRRPAHEVPAYVIRTEFIPYTVSGDVEKEELPLPDPGFLGSLYVPPQTKMEVAVCNAFAKVFQIARVGVDDDFIRMGGDSLKAIKLATLLAGVPGTAPVSPTLILHRRTPRTIASMMSSVEVMASRGYTQYIELNDAQMNILYQCRTRPKKMYNTAIRLKLRSGADPNSMDEILRRVYIASPILTAGLDLSGDHPRLEIGRGPEIEIHEGDPDEFAKIFSRPFDLTKDPLLRVALCLDKGSLTAFLDIHHLINDGVSVGALARKIAMAIRGERLELDRGILESADFDAKRHEDGRAKASEERFLSIMKDAELSPLLPKGPGKEIDQKTRRFTSSLEDIRSFASENGMTVTTFLCSAYGLAISKVSGRERPLMHLTIDGRGGITQSNSLGLYAKNIPVVLEKGSDDKSIVKATSDQILASMEDDACPLWTLQEKLGTITEVRFQYAYYLGEFSGYANLSRFKVVDVPGDPFYDLYVMVGEDKAGYWINSVTAPGYDTEFVDRITDALIETVEELCRGSKKK